MVAIIWKETWGILYLRFPSLPNDIIYFELEKRASENRRDEYFYSDIIAALFKQDWMS